MCGPGKHNCQPFCGPEGRFCCSDSVCSVWPAPFSYLCVRVRILCVLKIVCCCRIKPDCRSACCGLHFDRLRCQGHCPSTRLFHSITLARGAPTVFGFSLLTAREKPNQNKHSERKKKKKRRKKEELGRRRKGLHSFFKEPSFSSYAQCHAVKPPVPLLSPLIFVFNSPRESSACIFVALSFLLLLHFRKISKRKKSR